MTTEMTTQELIDYYTALLIFQYEKGPHARGTIAAYVAEALADQAIAQVRDAFNLPSDVGPLGDTAVGKQLETLASYRGLTRLIFGLNIARRYFLMPIYGDTGADAAPGFPNYGDAVTWFFFTYQNVLDPIYSMNDSELARVLQFRARSQGLKLTVGEIDTLLHDFFGDNAAVFESSLMGMTYVFLNDDPDSLSTLLYQTNSLPRPDGVKLTVMHEDSIAGFFGFQNYSLALNATFLGFGLYGTPQSAIFLRYP